MVFEVDRDNIINVEYTEATYLDFLLDDGRFRKYLTEEPARLLNGLVELASMFWENGHSFCSLMKSISNEANHKYQFNIRNRLDIGEFSNEKTLLMTGIALNAGRDEKIWLTQDWIQLYIWGKQAYPIKERMQSYFRDQGILMFNSLASINDYLFLFKPDERKFFGDTINLGIEVSNRLGFKGILYCKEYPLRNFLE